MITPWFEPSESIAQWIQTNGPFTTGGQVNCIGVSGTNLFAGTPTGFFLSTNEGASWTATTLKNVNTLTVASFPNATGGLNLFAGTMDGLYRSGDDGVSWTEVMGAGDSVVQSLVLVSGKLFAGTYNVGVLVSTDDGTTWTAASTGLTDTDVLSLAFSFGDSGDTNLFAGTYRAGAFLSMDDGATWAAVNAGLTNATVVSLCIFPNGGYGTNSFVGTRKGVFFSTDNGTSWTSIGLNGRLVRSLVYLPYETGDTDVFAGTDAGVFRLTYNDSTWVVADSEGVGNTFSLAVRGATLFAGTLLNGVFVSTNSGTSWTAGGPGLRYASPRSYCVSGGNLFVGTDNGVFILNNEDGTWTQVGSGLANIPIWAFAVSTDGTGDSTLLVATYNGIFVSTDGGASWIPANGGLTNTDILCLAVKGANCFAGTNGGGVFRSTDSGVNWAAVNGGLGDSLVYSLAVSGSDLFAGTSKGVFHSTDNGASWASANNGLTDTLIFTLAAFSNETGGTNLIAVTPVGGVFLSMDNGGRWSAVNNGLNPVWGISSVAAFGNNFFGGSDVAGVYVSTNRGTSWTSANDGLKDLEIVSITVLGSNLYVGTLREGVWRRPLTELITSLRQDSSVLAFRFTLKQNFPNPFNPTTVITYQLSAVSKVTLRVYDVLGREIKELVNDRESAGVHSVRFNASNLPSGVYLYRLQAGNYSDTKKLLLLK